MNEKWVKHERLPHSLIISLSRLSFVCNHDWSRRSTIDKPQIRTQLGKVHFSHLTLLSTYEYVSTRDNIPKVLFTNTLITSLPYLISLSNLYVLI